MNKSDREVTAETLPIAPAWMEPALVNVGELVVKKRLGHAYLVISEDPLQAALFAQCVALQQLCQQVGEAPCGVCLGCKSFVHKTHGDFLEVRVEPGKSAIGVEQIRAASRFLQQTALYGQIKILLIERAESMTPAAANSLLKTLEEPSGNSLLLLAVAEIWRLPPTIRSRCQLINLPLPRHEVAIAWLAQDNGWDTARAARALSLHNGRAVTARIEAEEERLSALVASFAMVAQAVDTPVSMPGVWGDVESSVLVYHLMSWCEDKIRATDLLAARAEGRRWLLLHRCLMALWSRLRGGAVPAKDIMSAEVYRLVRSTPHPRFQSVVDQFLAGLGKYGMAG